VGCCSEHEKSLVREGTRRINHNEEEEDEEVSFDIA
jgi:hypothetical protein